MLQDDWKPNTKALVSLALSCLSLTCCCMQWTISLMMAMAGVVLGISGLRDENPNQEDAAIAGIVVGAVGILASIVLAVIYIILSRNTSEMGLETLAVLVSMC